MSNLHKRDIVGQRLIRVVSVYEVRNRFNYFKNYFVLASGAVFQFPLELERDFVETALPLDGEEITDPDIAKVFGSTIVAVYRPIDAPTFPDFQDSILLQLDSGYWISQITSAPYETGGGGVYFMQEHNESIDYWDGRPD